VADRPRQPLIFGGGLDRSTGVLAVEETSFADLRNVYLWDGKAELRRGLFETITFAAGEEPIHAQPIRSQGLGLVFTYKPSTREVRVYQVSADGTSSVGSLVVWTLPVNAPFPKVSSDDSYGKVFIAHDEADYNFRQVTRIYDPVAVTLTNLQADLNTAIPGAVDVFFRGVRRHLNYLVGWGYGTETDPFRPEILRVSMPGQPDVFLPPHYFIVGQRAEPIVGCETVGKVLMIRKETDSHIMVGDARENFGVQPVDSLFGLASSRLMVTVGGVNYFWSLDGPRMSQAGPSDDLSTLLDLSGPLPDALATADISYGFALYNPDQREVEFIFGQWAYVLHLRNPQAKRWSYRKYGVQIGMASRFFAGVSGAPTGLTAPVAYADITATTPVGNHAVTINWDNLGALAGGELAEIWTHSLTEADTSWHLLADNIVVAGPNESATYNWFNPAATHEIAVRFKLGGVYHPAYVASDPSLWPAISRQQVVMPAYLLPPILQDAVWVKAGAVRSWDFHWQNSSEAGRKARVETSIDPLHDDAMHLKAWTFVADVNPAVAFNNETVNHVVEAAGNVPRWYRVILMDLTEDNVSEYRYRQVSWHNRLDPIPANLVIDRRSFYYPRVVWDNTDVIMFGGRPINWLTIQLHWYRNGVFLFQEDFPPGTRLDEFDSRPSGGGLYKVKMRYKDTALGYPIYGAFTAFTAEVFSF